MASHNPGPSSGMIDRIKRLLLQPKEEWARIDGEPATAQDVFRSWVVPLAAIGPVCGLIGQQVFGYGAWIVHFRPSLMFSITMAVVTYIMMLVGVWAMTLIIDALAPSFGGTKNQAQAMKVAAYGATASYIAGVFNILPALTILVLLGSLYSFYLFWIGLPMLMKVAADKAVPYVAAIVVAAIVVFWVIGAITGAITSTFVSPIASLASANTPGGTASIPGLGSIDTAKLDAATKKMQAASEQIQANAKTGTSSAIDANALQALLPGSISGWQRTSIESNSGSAAGIGGSKADADFSQGNMQFTLSVTDMGAMGSLATLGGAVNASSNRQTATAYEKTEMAGGNMVTEKWDNNDHSGSYGMMIASRFMVEANGSAPDIATLKNAVASVDAGKLASLAK